jgi:hypothetical protein
MALKPRPGSNSDPELEERKVLALESIASSLKEIHRILRAGVDAIEHSEVFENLETIAEGMEMLAACTADNPETEPERVFNFTRYDGPEEEEEAQ